MATSMVTVMRLHRSSSHGRDLLEKGVADSSGVLGTSSRMGYMASHRTASQLSKESIQNTLLMRNQARLLETSACVFPAT